MSNNPADKSASRLQKTKQQLIEEIETLERALADARRDKTGNSAIETWLQAIFEYAPVEIVIKDIEGRIVAISGNVASELNRHPDDFIGRTTADFLSADIAEIYMAADQKIMETGESSQQEVREVFGGKTRYSLNSKFPIRDSDGVITGICSLTSDITELKQSEKALRTAHDNLEQEIENRTRELVEQQKNLTDAQKIGHIGSYIYDNSMGKLVSFSDEYARIHGVGVDDVHGQLNMNLDHLTHPDDWDRTKAVYEQAGNEASEFEIEYRIIRPDGEIRYILEIGEPVCNDEGSMVWVKGIVQDITARTLLDRAKSEFISTVSHELRTPLTSIKGALGLVRAGAVGDFPEQLRSMLDVAYNNSDRLVLLINDILDIEKINAGKMDLQFEPVDLNELVSANLVANKGYGEEFGVNFVEGEMAQDIMVRGDRGRLMQAISNLLSNAAKFSPECEKVVVSVVHADKVARISVSDQGPGIPESFQDIMFDKFTQADSSDTRQRGGTGLGLSIVRSIVEHHGGRIWFETRTSDNAQNGTGTTFYVDLPKM